MRGRWRASSTLRRPTWSCRCAPRSRRRWSRTARWSFREAPARARAPAAGCRGDARAQARGGGGRDPLRLGDLSPAHLQRRGLPRLPEAGAVERNEIERESFLETVARVSRSASRDESRPVLTGVLMRFEPGKLVMAATDSLPPLGQGDAVGRSGARAGGDRPGARALGELTRIAAGRRRDRARRAREPGRLRDGRRACSPRGGSTGSSRTTSSSSRRRSTTRSRCRGTSFSEVVRRSRGDGAAQLTAAARASPTGS